MSSLYQIYLDGLKRLRGIETPEDFSGMSSDLTPPETDASGREFNPDQSNLSVEDETLLRALHTAIQSIEKDIDRFAFNRCVAHFRVGVTILLRVTAWA